MNEPTTVREGLIADLEAAERHLQTARELAYRSTYDGISPNTQPRRDRHGKPYVKMLDRWRLNRAQSLVISMLVRLSSSK